MSRSPQLSYRCACSLLASAQALTWIFLVAIAVVVDVHAAGTVTDSKSYLLQRSGVTQSPNPTTLAECIARKDEMIRAELATRTTGYVTYKCLDVTQSYVKFAPAPKCTAPRPAQESRTQECPPGTVGTWTQVRQYEAASYPQCWAAGEWGPATAPATSCATLPVQTLVYACADAGADGRVLESATVGWPNCQSASFRVPDRSLVVATNAGARPHYWRLASKLTRELVWTNGTPGWQLVSAIAWGTDPVPRLGSATVSWTPPTKYTDGSALTNLAGYRLLYGPAPDALTRTIDVPANVTTYIVENLPPGTWYFAATAYTTQGVQSDPSNIGSKVIR